MMMILQRGPVATLRHCRPPLYLSTIPKTEYPLLAHCLNAFFLFFVYLSPYIGNLGNYRTDIKSKYATSVLQSLLCVFFLYVPASLYTFTLFLVLIINLLKFLIN